MSGMNGTSGKEAVLLRELFTQVEDRLNELQREVLKMLLDGPKDTSTLTEHLAKLRWKNNSSQSLHGQICKIRKCLKDYYSTPPGFFEPYRLRLPNRKREYVLEAVENISARDASGFWDAHLGNGKRTLISIGETGFLQSQRTGLQFRHELTGDDPDFLGKHLPEAMPELKGDTMRRSAPYISIAEMDAVWQLGKYFAQHTAIPPEITNATSNPDEDANVIVLGTPFNNPIIRELETEAYYAEFPGRGSLFIAQDGLDLSKIMPNGEYRVWVHRRVNGSCCETLINASESALLKPICTYLTSDEDMAALIDDLLGTRPWMGFPSEFQLQLRIKMSADLKRVYRVRLQQYRGPSDLEADRRESSSELYTFGHGSFGHVGQGPRPGGRVSTAPPVKSLLMPTTTNQI